MGWVFVSGDGSNRRLYEIHWSMPILRRALLVLVLLTPACDKQEDAAPAPAPEAKTKYEPMMTQELVPPAAKGLVLGVATEKDVTAAFGAAEVFKDKSLGGDVTVEYSDEPAVMIELVAKDELVQGSAWLRGKGEPKLARLELVLKTTDTCKWVEDNVGKHAASKDRPGQGLIRRKYGPGEYTAGNADGTIPVGIECRASKREDAAVEVLTYGIEPDGGVSMMMNRNP